MLCFLTYACVAGVNQAIFAFSFRIRADVKRSPWETLVKYNTSRESLTWKLGAKGVDSLRKAAAKASKPQMLPKHIHTIFFYYASV